MNKIYLGDSLEVLKTLEENSIDSVVTDPPYGIGFMGKAWDTFVPSEVSRMKVKADARSVERTDGRKVGYGIARDAGTYDRSDEAIKDYQNWCYEWAKECLRVLKPGGHLVASNSSRMYHRMACAIEDAGFEIRDQIMWVYGSGFPKSLNIGKVVDKLRGNKREEVPNNRHGGGSSDIFPERDNFTTSKGTSEWEDWGTALKPAHEPIVLARKPLSEKTVAENCLKWRTGGLNINGCRVPLNGDKLDAGGRGQHGRGDGYGFKPQGDTELTQNGRFPANFIHDGSDEVVEMFPNTKSMSGVKNLPTSNIYGGNSFNLSKTKGTGEITGYSDNGSAARFFYCAKASKSERDMGLEDRIPERVTDGSVRANLQTGSAYGGTSVPRKNIHPTVKPLSLMRYLCRLITPPKGIVLDPFLGSGTTGIAAKLEGFDFIGIEKEEEYIKIAEARINAWNPQPQEQLF